MFISLFMNENNRSVQFLTTLNSFMYFDLKLFVYKISHYRNTLLDHVISATHCNDCANMCQVIN